MQESKLTPMQQVALDIIKEIIEIKRDVKTAPEMASYPEIFNSLTVEIKEALNQLCKNKMLEWHNTVNGVIEFALKQ